MCRKKYCTTIGQMLLTNKSLVATGKNIDTHHTYVNFHIASMKYHVSHSIRCFLKLRALTTLREAGNQALIVTSLRKLIFTIQSLPHSPAFTSVCLWTIRVVAWYISSDLSVCMSVWQTITFESLDVRSSYLHMRYIWTDYGSSSYMKVIGQGQGHGSQKGWKFLFPQCETAIGHNSRSIKHRPLMFACSMGFLAKADRMMWPPSLSRDRKWRHRELLVLP